MNPGNTLGVVLAISTVLDGDGRDLCNRTIMVSFFAFGNTPGPKSTTPLNVASRASIARNARNESLLKSVCGTMKPRIAPGRINDNTAFSMNAP